MKKISYFLLFLLIGMRPVSNAQISSVVVENVSIDQKYLAKKYSKRQYRRYAKKWANHFDLEYDIVKAVIFVESSWDHAITSNKGAQGLMQVMPGTARDMGMPDSYSLYNPNSNTYYGCMYLRQVLDKFEGNYRLALIAYYSGPGNAALYQAKKKETRFFRKIDGYAQKVLAKSTEL